MSFYFLSKLTKPTIAWVNMILGAGKNRCDAFALALAYVISLRITMPVERLEDPSQYFRLTNLIPITNLIDKCNEVLPMNMKMVRQAVEAFFLFRYHTQFPMTIPLALRKETAIEDFFGLGKYFSDDILTVIKTDFENLTQFINQLTVLVEEIEKEAKWAVQEQEKDLYVA